MNKSLKNKKSIVALIAILALALIGGTFAFFHAELSADNKLSTGGYGVKMVEKFKAPDNWEPGEKVEKKVTFTNEKANKVVLRVKAVESWGKAEDNTDVATITKDTEDKVFSENKVAKVGNAGNTDDWEYKDGYWYYKEVMNKGKSVDFLDSVTLDPDFVPSENKDGSANVETTKVEKDGVTTITATTAESNYTLTITGEFVQAHKDAVEGWPEEVRTDLGLN